MIRIPGVNQDVSLTLSGAIKALRDKALAIQKSVQNGWWQINEFTLAEAAAWRTHTDDEDWQVWRARRFAARLAAMPVEVEDGELIVGKPLIGRKLSDAEQNEIDYARKALENVPPFPGGDRGHFHPNYERLFDQGVGGLVEQITAARAARDISDEQRAFYDACRIAMQAFQAFIVRVADACDDEAIAETCRAVANRPPQTFHEACQLMFLTYVAAWFGEEHVMTCYGRIDRTLDRFYAADIAAGRLTPQRALDILNCMYIQVNRTCPFGLAVGIIVAGRGPGGQNVVNPVTYLALAAREATKLCYPTLAIAWNEQTPDELVEFAMRMLTSGVNDPAFYNDDLIAAGLQDHGVSVSDSHNFMNSTCVEIKTVGNSNIWVATRYHNVTGALLEAMRRESAGQTPAAKTLEELQARTLEILETEVRDTAANLDGVWTQREQTGCLPFASCLIDDCLDRGIEHDRGGCRYHWAENSFVGLANLTDSLVAVDELVFRNREMTLGDLYAICAANFEGHEPLRRRIMTRMPKYGNDDDRADAIAVALAGRLCDITEAQSVGGHRYVPGFFCHVNHARLGQRTGATPDGRLAGAAFADGAGASQGRETCGPTAAILSTTKWSHRKALGGLVQNVRFSRSMLERPGDRQAVRAVIETYLRRGGFEIQMNIVSADTLHAAVENPEDYSDLVVRVAGYSDYFTSLQKELQDEVIARTEFE